MATELSQDENGLHILSRRACRLALVAVVALALIAAACSSGSESDEAVSTTTSEASISVEDEAPTDVAEPEPPAEQGIVLEDVVSARNAAMPDPEITESVARTYCEAWAAPRDVDAMVAMLTDDAVMYDGVTGDRYEGPQAAGTYIETAMPKFDKSRCGPAVLGGDWAAITYTLSSTESGEGVEGVAAIRVLDDKVDWHLTYYAGTDDAQPPGEGSLSDAQTASLTYCEAFADPAHDPDVILATMTDGPEIYGIPNNYSAVGADAIRKMIAYEVEPTDVNTCGYEGTLVHGGWEGGVSSTLNESLGLWLEGVNVLEVIDGKVDRHFLHLSTFDGAEYFGDRWGVTD